MKLSNDRSLGEILKEMLETYRLEGKLNEIKVIQSYIRSGCRCGVTHLLAGLGPLVPILYDLGGLDIVWDMYQAVRDASAFLDQMG